MIRKTLLFPIYFCLVLISCDTKTKEAHTEESTERRDIFYNNQNTEKLADSLGEMPRITIDKTTGIFNIAGKVVELKQTDESKFNEICTPELKYDQSPVCEGINDLEKCRMLFESWKINQSNAPVKRESDNLFIKLKNGKTKTLTNNIPKPDEGAEEYVVYIFSNYFSSLEVVAIEAFYHEGGSMLLIDLESGEEMSAYGDVRLSPDGKKLVSYSWDLMLGFRPNGIQIFEKKEKSKKLTCILSFETSAFGPEAVCWMDNKTLIVKQLDAISPSPLYRYAIMRVSDPM